MQATTTLDLTGLTDAQLAQAHTYAITATAAGAVQVDLLTAVEAERARRDPNAVPSTVARPEPVGPNRQVSRTRLTSGFTSILVEISVDDGQVNVTGTRLYATNQAVWVEDVKTRTFWNLPDATAFAADWVKSLVGKGWKR